MGLKPIEVKEMTMLEYTAFVKAWKRKRRLKYTQIWSLASLHRVENFPNLDAYHNQMGVGRTRHKKKSRAENAADKAYLIELDKKHYGNVKHKLRNH